MYRHSHAVFELLDIDGGHTVAPAEFQATRFLFNIRKTELSQIFKDFDISGDEVIQYDEHETGFSFSAVTSQYLLLARSNPI